MLVQALAAYADQYLAAELKEASWEVRHVHWMIEISGDGAFLGVVPRMTTVKRGKKQVPMPQPLDVPRSPVARNSGHYPLLGVDDIAYVLGVGSWTGDKAADRAKTEKHHEAFIALIARAAAATADEALASCARFYADQGEVEKARTALGEAKPGDLVALSVRGALTLRPAVRTYWREHYEAAFAARVEGNSGECLVTGVVGPIAPTHEKIKGASSLGGQSSGVALMSFDKEAFRSYGWEQNQNSPVSPGRALAYVLALNALLRSGTAVGSEKGRRVDIAGIGFLTWLRNPEDFDALDPFLQADPESVAKLLRFNLSDDPDPNRFYLLGVSGNGGRLRVRYWLDESLPRIKQNLKEWHEQLRVAYPWGDAPPVRLWQLQYAIHRDGKPEAHETLALLRRGFEGRTRRLGYGTLAATLRLLRHPARSSTKDRDDPYSLTRLRVPLCLVRMCLNDLRKEGQTEMSEGLDPSCRVPAYVCGRLLAEYENLQRAASSAQRAASNLPRAASEPPLNNTIIDRYFALASTYPAAAMPKIELLAISHLKKLRRDKPGAAVAVDTRLGELHALLAPTAEGPYPRKLGLDGQGLFVLGYYHQKARSIAQAAERKQAKDSAENEKTQESEK